MNSKSPRSCLFGLPLLLAAGCSPSDERSDQSAAGVRPAPRVWVATETGAGPVRIGMTFAEAAGALGIPVAGMIGHAAPSPSCHRVALPGAPPGVTFVLVDGRVARVDVERPSVATSLGARVGDSVARVAELYRGRVAMEPHPPPERGHHLVVRPAAAADSAYRLVFETEGARVARYRAGLMPAVARAEGCA